MVGRMTSPPALRARGIRVSFGDHTVLHDVDLDLPWGAVTAIAGPNGAGKSTLVEVLAGVRTPQRGTVDCADDVALVVQRPEVADSLPVTVRDVVAMGTWRSRSGRRERRARVDSALHEVDLAGLAARPFSTLSGGQRQRVLLAQGIARRARVFLLDEPAAGLDAASRDRTRQLLAAAARTGAAVACVTHDDTAIEAADVVVRLEDGRRVR
jgi:zinc/manganese transport system ATP-binding protein